MNLQEKLTLYCLIQAGIIEDDKGAIPAKLQGDFLQAIRAYPRY